MTSNTLSIVGAGGHGRVIADSAALTSMWDSIQFFDDATVGRLASTEWDVAGTIANALEESPDAGHSIVIGLGDNTMRFALQNEFQKAGWQIATVIHPTATISAGASLGAGTVVMAGAIVNIGTSIGPGCIVNTRSSIDHDCKLGASVHVSPGATIAGGVTIGDRCWIGAGATVIQGINIGERTMVGAGSVVVRNIPGNVTCIGNPAKVRD